MKLANLIEFKKNLSSLFPKRKKEELKIILISFLRSKNFILNSFFISDLKPLSYFKFLLQKSYFNFNRILVFFDENMFHKNN
jgi:hypothetical protein